MSRHTGESKFRETQRETKKTKSVPLASVSAAAAASATNLDDYDADDEDEEDDERAIAMGVAIKKMKVKELRQECAKAMLNESDLKAELQDRLLQHYKCKQRRSD